MRDETRCCGFYAFAITVGADAVELRVRAPEGAGPLLDSLYEVFDPAGEGAASG